MSAAASTLSIRWPGLSARCDHGGGLPFIKLTRGERPDLRLVSTEFVRLSRPVEKSGTLAFSHEIVVIADTCSEPDTLKISAEFAKGSKSVAESGNCVLDEKVSVIAHTCATPDQIILATSVQPSKGVTSLSSMLIFVMLTDGTMRLIY